MITIRNPMACQARTVIAGESLKVGHLVYLVANATAGEPCKIMKTVDHTQTGDATLEKGVVYFIHDNDLSVDFILNPATNVRTLNTGVDNTTDIAVGSVCTFWYQKPVVGFTVDSLKSGLATADFAAGDKVAFVGGLLCKYNSGGTDGSQDYMGVVYENDGHEVTVMLNKF